jgi:hypothetical protein
MTIAILIESPHRRSAAYPSSLGASVLPLPSRRIAHLDALRCSIRPGSFNRASRQRATAHRYLVPLCGCEIDHQFELSRQGNRQVGGVGALEDTIGICRRLMVLPPMIAAEVVASRSALPCAAAPPAATRRCRSSSRSCRRCGRMLRRRPRWHCPRPGDVVRKIRPRPATQNSPWPKLICKQIR